MDNLGQVLVTRGNNSTSDDQLGQLMAKLFDVARKKSGQTMSEEEWAEHMREWNSPESQAERYNSTTGKLDASVFDCPHCLNKGAIYRVVDGAVRASKCKCSAVRRSLHEIQRAKGHGFDAKGYTLEGYEQREQWQKSVFRKAMSYADNQGDWLFVSGVTGSGKTHICTAIAKKRLYQEHKSLLYTTYQDLMTRLRGTKYDHVAHEKAIADIVNAGIVYIDDLFKYQTPDAKLAKEDYNYIIEVINARYNARKPLIMSTEWSMKEVEAFDKSVAGRIVEMCGEYIIHIGNDDARNWRMKGCK